ncbi:MAG: twin-arginine translocase subunit TatC [Phycisphaeraceae bacterium]
MAKAAANPDEFRMSFGDHLDELRSRLIKGLIGLLVVMLFTLYFGKDIVRWLVEPLNQAQIAAGLPPQTITSTPIGSFAIYIKVALLGGLIIAGPWIMFQIWKFIEAGLYHHERKVMYILAPFSGFMMMLGVMFMYYIMLPVCLAFFMVFSVSFGPAGGDGTSVMDFILRMVRSSAGETEGPEIDSSPEVPDDGAKLTDPTKDTTKEPAKDAGKTLPNTTPDATKQPGSEPGAPDEGPKAAPKKPIATLPQLAEDPVKPRPGQVWINTRQNALKVVVGDRVLVSNLAVASVVSPLINLGEYISFVLWITLGMVVAFQMPVVLLVGAWLGILNPYALAKARKYVVFACFCVGAVLTPADPISMFVLALPLWFLFEMSLIVMRLIYKKREGDDDEGDGNGDGDGDGDGEKAKGGEGEPAPA